MFEKAARKKFRFHFRGSCSTEDLWDLDVEQLDLIFKNLSRQAKAQEEESLLKTESQESETLNLKIAIVKHIVATKLVEQEERESATLNAARKQRLLTMLGEKQDDALRDLSEDELQEQIDAL